MKRKVSIFGDSISTFEGWNPDGFAVYYTAEKCEAAGLSSVDDTWWWQMIDRLDASLLVNASWSGSMVEGAGYPAGCSDERIEALSVGGVLPDDIVVFMGINDYGWGGAAAQACGRSRATPPRTDLSHYPESEAGAPPADALEKFERAYETLTCKLRKSYPDANVWCCSLLAGRLAGSKTCTHAWNLRGVPMSRYSRSISRAAAKNGCTFLDLASFGLDYEALDGTHPTWLGMRQLAELVAAAIEGRPVRLDPYFLPDSSATYGRVVDWKSSVLCPERSCLGCAWAKGTGNSWFCVCNKPHAGD